MIDRRKLSRIMDKAAGARIAVVGDLMLDVYIWGKASRISQEAPVPVVQVKKQTQTIGGAANVMRNIVSLGANARAFGIVGKDDAGKRIRSIISEQGIDDEFVITDSSRSSTQKQRIIAGTQQLLRIDYEKIEPVSGTIRNKLSTGLLSEIRKGKVDAIIFEDYAKGVLSKEFVDHVNSEAVGRGLVTALDPHPSQPFEVKHLTLMTPNRLEAFALSGTYYREPVRPVEKDKAMMDVAEKIMGTWVPEHLLMTLGADGMALFEKSGKRHIVPTKAREVFDVSGAGDTVIASFVLALLGGATPSEAAEISNHAAGVVVGKIGTAAVTVDELFESFFERE